MGNLFYIFFICHIARFGLLIPGFLDMSNLLYSINDFAYIALAAIPMTFVIITGGIDVSVGSIIGLSSITLGVLWTNGMDIWLALLVTLLVSAAAGFVNGISLRLLPSSPLSSPLGECFYFPALPWFFQAVQVPQDMKESADFRTFR